VRRYGEGGGDLRRHHGEIGAVYRAAIDDDLEVVGPFGRPGLDEGWCLRRFGGEVDRRRVDAVQDGAGPGREQLRRVHARRGGQGAHASQVGHFVVLGGQTPLPWQHLRQAEHVELGRDEERTP
jgi:hypothetical protein